MARDLVRSAVANVFAGFSDGMDTRAITDWFDAGGSVQLGDTTPAVEVLKQARRVRGLVDLARRFAGDADAGEGADGAAVPFLASAVDFILEGLYALKKIARSEERGYHGAEVHGPRRPARQAEAMYDEGLPAQGKKKYYN
ncbi:MAG: hypothetical protein EHM13_08970 [Acidobacteria bacterium]|nr:MAG: hypothetical protein EHM13_08970 [Acidobacteriota bacterium]